MRHGSVADTIITMTITVTKMLLLLLLLLLDIGYRMHEILLRIGRERNDGDSFVFRIRRRFRRGLLRRRSAAGQLHGHAAPFQFVRPRSPADRRIDQRAQK